MYHSITIGDKNTWDDWHLIPTSRPYVTLPTLKEKTIEIPGKSGVIDLTEYLFDSRKYNNRKGSWEFYIMHEYWASWSRAYTAIANYVHTSVHECILEDAPEYYYEGRLRVSAYTPDKNYSRITIEYDFLPYRTNIQTGTKTIT